LRRGPRRRSDHPPPAARGRPRRHRHRGPRHRDQGHHRTLTGVDMSMRTVVIASRTGLHARPAALFVKAAADQGVPVRIRAGGGKAAPARSMAAVLPRGAGHGTEVTLEADGPGADDALDALAALLARDLDAEEPSDA